MMRIGHGYDVHRFAAGRKLVLGGVDIPFEMGLLGHSDADATVLAERPRLRPFIDAMRTNIAADLGLPISAVSVKATTEEGLGFTGKMEGMAAHAVCLLTEK